MSERRRTSDVLGQLAARANPHISIGGLCDGLEDRAFGILLLILAMLACVPSVPGVSGVLGSAVLLVSVQILVGRHRLWLPRPIRERRISGETFGRAVARVTPSLRRLERLCRPRLAYLTTGPLEQLAGLAILLLGLVIALPIPFIGNLPPALAIIVLAIGFIERDGLAVAIGLVLAMLAVAVTSAFTVATVMVLLGILTGSA